MEHRRHTTPISSSYLSDDEVRLYVHQLGRGEPIIFLHGGLADHRAALAQVGPLAATHRLILPDLRSSGRSHCSGPLSWDRLADDIAQLMDHLGLSQTIVGGASGGTGAALRLALRHPDRVSALLLVAPLYGGHGLALNKTQRAAFAAMAQAGERCLEEGISALEPLFAHLPEPIRGAALEMIQSFDAASVAATTRLFASAAMPFGGAEELARVEAPTLLVPGADAMHPPETAELYAEALANVTVQEVANLMSEELAGTIARFCSAVAR